MKDWLEWDGMSIVWAVILVLVFFSLLRAARRSARAKRRRAEEKENRRVRKMLDEKYAPTPITSAPEPRHWADSIPYPIVTKDKPKAQGK